MITTSHTKSKIFDGLYSTGDPASREVVFMMGSCRGIPHLNFLHQYNEAHGRPFLIYYLDPFDFNWDRANQRTNLDMALAEAAVDERILSVLGRTTIFIHEYFGHFGMFNTARDAKDNIYRHGMEAKIDVCLPNFHDRFILFQNILDFDEQSKALMTSGQRDAAFERMKEIGTEAMAAFREMCAHTSFPEFADYFEWHRRATRLFWNHNHVSKGFTVPLFRLTAEKFLRLQLSESFMETLWAGPDMYANANVCPLTREDVEAHDWDWGEPLHDLKT